MFKPSFLSAAILAVSTAAPVMAQTLETTPVSGKAPDEVLVVIASRTETPLRQVGSSVSVLDEQALKTLGTPSLVDALRTMPSVSVVNTGGMGKASSIRIRGEEGHRTLVRVDGVDISDPTSTQPSAQIQHVLNSNVARVELLRGPQGMMYGADAGGVLNITTDHITQGSKAGVSLEAGRYDSRKTAGFIGGGGERGDFYLSAAQVDTDGFNAFVDTSVAEAGGLDDDGYENTTVHARGGWNIDPELRAQLVVRDTDSTSQFDKCFGADPQDCVGYFDQQNLRGSITHQNAAGENTIAYSKTDVERTNYASGEVSYDTEGTIAKWELNGNVALNKTHALVYGAEHRQDEVNELEREQQGAYLEYQGAYHERVYLTAGIRQDDNEDFGGHTSYRVSAAYLFPKMSHGVVKLKSSVGTGFRAPSLFEIDYNRSSDGAELPALAPEESQGVDVGIEYLGSDGTHLEAVLFDQTIDDELYFDLVSYSGYLQSEQSSESRGLELIGQWPLSDQWQLNANYTYVDAEAEDGSPRSRQPEHLANIGVRYTPTRDWTVALDWRTSRDRYEGDIKIEDYEVLNANVRYQVVEGIVVYVRGENILDEDYVEVPSYDGNNNLTGYYNTSGAAGYAGVEFTF
ncbi:TonB-dependent receptor plug domain-containing protein [Marinimicrobium agarilyticum]|uniref:TonB-dependent receptor plug domain-containing protein n=1 Tax=Marinimicrobium agarilyticum TaxID=306546 RepID=UPI0003F814F2|nr:TonB-dependent receptor [Marinimicrobium agarilyticum]